MDKKKNNNKLIYFIGIVAIIALIILLIINITKNGNNETNNSGEEIVSGVEGVIGVSEYIRELDDGTKLNTSEELKKEKEFDGLKVKDIQLTSKDDNTTLVAYIENDSGNDMNDIISLDVILLTNQGDEIITVPTQIKPLKVGEGTQLNVNLSFDYSSAYDFKIIVK